MKAHVDAIFEEAFTALGFKVAFNRYKVERTFGW